MKLIKIAAAVAVAGFALAQDAGRSRPITLDTRYKGFELGVCAYSFRAVTAFEAVDKAKECGAEIIEFFLWQKLSPEHPDLILNQHLPTAHVDALKAKLQQAGIKAVNAYCGDFGKDEAQVRQLFTFAQRLGLRGLTGEPPLEMLDTIEKLVKETGIQLCFHNHPKNPGNPGYRNWDPAYLMEVMCNRDPRMGFSVDTGHVYRSAMDPVEYLKKVAGRVNSVHLKEVKECKLGSPDVPYGRGCGDIAAILAELKNQQFSGHVGVEFDDVSPQVEQDVKDCLEFVRKHRQ